MMSILKSLIVESSSSEIVDIEVVVLRCTFVKVRVEIVGRNL